MIAESAFQFTRPALKSMTVSFNDSFEHSEDSKIIVNITTQVINKQYNEETNENIAEVVLSAEIGSREDSCSPFYIFAEETAKFKWPAGKFNDSETEKLLKGNAPSLLLSYLRPIIAMITSASIFPSYNIPFVDLTKHS